MSISLDPTMIWTALNSVAVCLIVFDLTMIHRRVTKLETDDACN
jgi:hypothetical protein